MKRSSGSTQLLLTMPPAFTKIAGMQIRTNKIFTLIFLTAVLSAGSLFALGQTEYERVNDSFLAIGTTCSISIDADTKGRVAGTDNLQASDIFSEIRTLVDDIEQQMSVTIADSTANKVNKAAGLQPVEISADFYKVLSEGLQFSEKSGGTFDITIGPLVSLWGIGSEDARVPSKAEINAALELVDYNRLSLTSDSGKYYAFLETEKMKLEPGGVAKGFSADKIAEYLHSVGVSSSLINLGGNVLALGTKLDGSEWRIGIQNPDTSRGEYIGVLSISNKAVVSSGKYERFFIEDDRRYHHILSTKDGYPVENGIAQVSIICPVSMQADAMSTTVFSLGVEAGLALVEEMPDTEAIILMENKDMYLTSGLGDSFSLTDTSYNEVGR